MGSTACNPSVSGPRTMLLHLKLQLAQILPKDHISPTNLAKDPPIIWKGKGYMTPSPPATQAPSQNSPLNTVYSYLPVLPLCTDGAMIQLQIRTFHNSQRTCYCCHCSRKSRRWQTKIRHLGITQQESHIPMQPGGGETQPECSTTLC